MCLAALEKSPRRLVPDTARAAIDASPRAIRGSDPGCGRGCVGALTRANSLELKPMCTMGAPNFVTSRVVPGSCFGLAAVVVVALEIESTRGDALGQQVVLASAAAPAAIDDDTIVPACTTNMRLSGAVCDTARPERSLALFVLGLNQRAGVAS
jgi:hypothetical protein